MVAASPKSGKISAKEVRMFLAEAVIVTTNNP
jgi:hypothetical protein